MLMSVPKTFFLFGSLLPSVGAFLQTPLLRLSFGLSSKGPLSMTSSAPLKSGGIQTGQETPGETFDSWFWWNAHAEGGVEHAVFQNTQSAVVLFDGACNFCNAGVWMMISNSDSNSLRFCSQGSEMGEHLLHSFGQDAVKLSSIAVLDKTGHLHTQSDAVVEICRRMQLPFPLLAGTLSLIPRPIRDEMYHAVSVRRHAFGEPTSCRIPDDDEFERFVM